MVKISVILVLVGLTAMASAFTFDRPPFDQGLQTEKLGEEAQFMEQLQGKMIHTRVKKYI